MPRVSFVSQVEALCQEKGVTLPADMLKTAAQYGLRASVLNKFFAALQVQITHSP